MCAGLHYTGQPCMYNARGLGCSVACNACSVFVANGMTTLRISSITAA